MARPDEFKGYLDWIQVEAKGDIFPFRVQCKQAIPFGMDKKITQFLNDYFGTSGIGDPDRRWHYHRDHNWVAFKTEVDMVVFVMAWRGQV